MQLPSDTPPDGDFARYIEQLTAKSSAQAPGKPGMPAASHGQYGEGNPLAAEHASPAVRSKQAARVESPQPLAGISLWAVGKWVVIAWIALEVLSAVFPGAGMMVLPLLMGFAAWAFYRFKKYSPDLLKARLRELAEQAAKELKQRK